MPDVTKDNVHEILDQVNWGVPPQYSSNEELQVDPASLKETPPTKGRSTCASHCVMLVSQHSFTECAPGKFIHSAFGSEVLVQEAAWAVV